MSIAVADNPKNGYYDTVNGKAHTGERMKMGENIGVASYFEPNKLFIDILKGSQLNGDPTGSGAVGPNTLGYFDTTIGAWGQLAYSGPAYIRDGTWVVRWRGTATNVTLLVSGDQFMTETLVSHYLVNTQNQTDYDNVTGDADIMTNGSFNGGSGFSVSDVITLASAAVVTVTSVNAGEVDGFTVNSSSQSSDETINVADSQSGAASPPGGTGFLLTPHEANIQRRREYTSTDNTPSASMQMRAVGGTCKEVAVIQPGNEARYDAGNIFTDLFVSDNAGLSTMRPLGLSGTNDSWLRDVSDFINKDYISYLDHRSLPADVFARMSVEADVDIWWTVYHQLTDAAITAYATTLNSIVPADKKVYVELSNEVWNAGSGFNDQFKWVSREDAPVGEATVDPVTGICTDVGHGMTSGETIAMFNNHTHRSSFPYTQGGARQVYATGTDTFQLSTSSTLINAVTNANPCVVTAFGSEVDIFDIFKENPCRITVEQYEAGHGIITGDEILIQNSGVSQLDGNVYTVTIPQGSSVTLTLDGIDATTFDNHTRGSGTLLTNHPFNNTDVITITDVGGMTELNDISYTVANKTTFTIELTGIDSTLFGTYTSGGVIVEPVNNLENVGAPISTDITFIRYKRDGLSILDNGKNYVDHAVEIWDLCRPVLGDKMIAVGASQRAVAGRTATQLADSPAYQAKLDFLAVASYIRFNGSTVGDFDMTGKTEAELNTYMRDIEMPGVQQQMQAHIDVLGHIRLVNYEGGDHNDSVQTEALNWARSVTGVTPIYNEWAHILADTGVKLYTHLSYCNDYLTSTFGRVEFPGENSAKQQGHQEFYDNGGAPKN